MNRDEALASMRRSSSRRTICEVHREIYDACADIVDPARSAIRNLVLEAFVMAKKMDAKLCEYKADWSEGFYGLNENRKDDRLARKRPIQVTIPSHADGGEQWRWEWVADFAKQRGWKLGAELGVRRGHFSVYLVDNVPGLSMIAVDTWAQEGISQNYERYKHDNNYKVVLDRFECRPIEIKRMLTHDAAKEVPDGSLDFAFIDASHEYEAVLQDIDDWRPKVKDMLLGHDWERASVRQAVHERFGHNVLIGPDQCWAVRV